MKLTWQWAMPNKWTFQMKPILAFVEKELFKHTSVLIPFGGMKRWPQHPGMTYIDIEEGRPKPYLLEDCRDVMQELTKQGKKYSLIISDPPFSMFQAVHSYGNTKMQDITYVRQLYDQLLLPGGIIIHCGFNSTGMGITRGYQKQELLVVNCGGSHNDFLILKEKKMQSSLDNIV